MEQTPRVNHFPPSYFPVLSAVLVRGKEAHNYSTEKANKTILRTFPFNSPFWRLCAILQIVFFFGGREAVSFPFSCSGGSVCLRGKEKQADKKLKCGRESKPLQSSAQPVSLSARQFLWRQVQGQGGAGEGMHVVLHALLHRP